MITIKEVNHYNVKELSSKLQLSIVTIRKYIKENKFRAVKIGREYYVSDIELKKYFEV